MTKYKKTKGQKTSKNINSENNGSEKSTFNKIYNIQQYSTIGLKTTQIQMVNKSQLSSARNKSAEQY